MHDAHALASFPLHFLTKGLRFHRGVRFPAADPRLASRQTGVRLRDKGRYRYLGPDGGIGCVYGSLNQHSEERLGFTRHNIDGMHSHPVGFPVATRFWEGMGEREA